MSSEFPIDASKLIFSFISNESKKEQRGEDNVEMHPKGSLHLQEEEARIQTKTLASSKRTLERGNSDQNDSLIIQEWKPCTTRSLLTDGNNQRINTMEACTVLDRAFGRRFLNNLRDEIHERKMLDRLTPAKTLVDHQINKLLMFAGSAIGEGSTISSDISFARKDLSVFIPRSFRSTPKFQTDYPSFSHMISTIEATAKRYLEIEQNSSNDMHIKFDTSLTSVQLAMYPGDGESGYKRHCDTGAICEQDSSLSHHNHDLLSDSSQNTPTKRIITAVYYVTDDDWDKNEDGGSLRVFESGREGGNKFHDLIPYPDRLVLFRSDLVEHQVLPSKKRPRIAITVWLHGQIICTNSNLCSSNDGFAVPSLVDQHFTSPPKPKENRHIAALKIESDELSPSHKDKKIFVSIPAYRDTETRPTIISLIENATYEDRIYVGVVYQYDTQSEEEDVKYRKNGLPLPHPWHKSNLRQIILDHRDATGPCYARFLAQSLHRGEDYLLQIDSHMRMRPRWDEYLIQQLHKCEQPETSILTTYPPGYSLQDGVPDEIRPTILVPWKFDKNGMLRQKGRLLNYTNDGNPRANNNIPCPLFAAGFNFSMSQVIIKCPYDKNLPYLFFGEELSMAVRLFTNGYNFFSPPTSVCYHLWSRDHRVTYQADMGISSERVESEDSNDGIMAKRQESITKVLNQLLGQHSNEMGKVRAVEQFWENMGVNFIERQVCKDAQNARLDPRLFVHLASPHVSYGDASDLLTNVFKFLVLK